MAEIATLAAVKEAAEKLARNKPAADIKAEEIRGKIGGGSFTTINKRLAEWRDQREAEQLFQASVPEMPEEVRDLWERVWKLAEAQHHETRKIWADEKRKLLDDIEERDTEIERLEREAAESQMRNETIAEDLEKAREATLRAEKERDRAISRADATEDVLEKLTARLGPSLAGEGSEKETRATRP